MLQVDALILRTLLRICCIHVRAVSRKIVFSLPWDSYTKGTKTNFLALKVDSTARIQVVSLTRKVLITLDDKAVLNSRCVFYSAESLFWSKSQDKETQLLLYFHKWTFGYLLKQINVRLFGSIRTALDLIKKSRNYLSWDFVGAQTYMHMRVIAYYNMSQ